MKLKELLGEDRIVFRGTQYQIKQMERCCAAVGNMFLELMPTSSFDSRDYRDNARALISIHGFQEIRAKPRVSLSRGYANMHIHPANGLVINQVFLPKDMSSTVIQFPNFYLPGYDAVADRNEDDSPVKQMNSAVCFGHRGMIYVVHSLADGEEKRIEEEAKKNHRASLAKLKKGISS